MTAAYRAGHRGRGWRLTEHRAAQAVVGDSADRQGGQTPTGAPRQIRTFGLSRRVRRTAAAAVICGSVLLAFTVEQTWADEAPQSPDSNMPLKRLSLEELGNVEVTTVSKNPQPVQKTPAAVFVITQDDIRRSGARVFRRLCAWRLV